MADDIATTLNAVLDRMVEQSIDAIAKDGLKVLKQVLDSSGFSKSEYLKDYRIFASVTGEQVEFQIQLNIESVVTDDEATQQAMDGAKKQSTKAVEERAARLYGWGKRGPQRIIIKPARDARKPAGDARKPAKDARKSSDTRTLEHEVALHAPRRAELDRAGKLKVSIRRTTQKVADKTEMPKGDFQGIAKTLTDKLQKVITDNFAPKLEEIILNYAV